MLDKTAPYSNKKIKSNNRFKLSPNTLTQLKVREDMKKELDKMPEKPFSYSHFNKKFSHKCALIQCEEVHIDERPFSCSKCDKKFSVQDDLRKHEEAHIDQRPFSCTECDKSFAPEGYIPVMRTVG